MFKKKNNLKTAIAIVCMGMSLGVSAAATKKPNVVTIMIDDMGFSDLGKFGGEIDTPNIDGLISEGTQLTNFYTAATSGPARGMFFTGRDSHASGMGNLKGFVADRPPQVGAPGYEGVLTKSLPTFPELLQENGYHTIMTGKWHMGDKPGEYPSDRGFTDTLALLPGGDVQYLSDAEGKLLSSLPPPLLKGLGGSPYNKNGLPVTTFPPNAYTTDFYTDEAIKMLDARPDKSKPFYVHISHIVSHGPIQAPTDLIDKYLPTYSQGWDKLRSDRFNKLKSLGLVKADAVLPPRDVEVVAWNKLSADEKKVEARRMAAYAGMVDKLDQSVGNLIQHLKDIGEYDNTVFFVMSDNGAAAMEPALGPAGEKYLASKFSKDTIDKLSNMGSASSFIPPSPGLGMLNNTPFKRFKTETFDAGVHTAAFMFSPTAAAASKGAKYNCLSSMMDISATILDVTGATYPTSYNGNPISPLDGISMGDVLEKGDLSCKQPDRTLGFEQDGAKMMIQGEWKIAQQWIDQFQRYDGHMYLFNLAKDPFEQRDLSKTAKTEYTQMLSLYDAYAEKNGVVNVGPRIFSSTANLKMEPSTGMILGGTQVNYGTFNHVPVLPDPNVALELNAPKLGDTVDIAAEFYPPKEHQGKKGYLMAAAYHKESAQWTVFKGGYNDSGKLLISNAAPLAEMVDGSIMSPNFNKVPYFGAPVKSFSDRVELPIYEGKLTSTPAAGKPGFNAGTYYFWVGYKLSDGTIEHSASPIVLNVNP